ARPRIPTPEPPGDAGAAARALRAAVRPGTRAPGHLGTLERAFRPADPAERLRLCVQALDDERSPGALVAAASACMEVNDLEAARRDLEEAVSAAPAWAAARFERAKLFLRLDYL